jgi:hypothetical protein
MSKTLQFPARREMLTGEAVQQYLASITTPLTEFQYVVVFPVHSDFSFPLTCFLIVQIHLPVGQELWT